MNETYKPTESEQALSDTDRDGRYDETGGEVGEADREALATMPKPEDLIAYRDECEAMGQ